MQTSISSRLDQAGFTLDVAHPDGRILDRIATAHARGWLQACGGPRRSRDEMEAAMQAALARGFVAADAAVLARAGDGDLPLLSFGEDLPPATMPAAPAARRPLGLYAIAETAQRLRQLVEAGVRTVQLRIKTPAAPDAAWHAGLRRDVADAVAVCAAGGADLFVNDHWRLAVELGAPGVHLGQEDLLAMGAEGRRALRDSGVALGVSSHSPWELCRARSLAPRYIACGPVWPTITKAMPWVPQGLDNLAWWCRMAGAPVVAIGGVLEAAQARAAMAAGADGVCVVRGLGADPAQTVPALLAAVEEGRRAHADAPPAPAVPHPTLPAG